MTYEVNATHLWWNFDDLEVFYKDINFALNVYGNMLKEDSVSTIAINHTHTKTSLENMDFFLNNKTDYNTEGSS